MNKKKTVESDGIDPQPNLQNIQIDNDNEPAITFDETDLYPTPKENKDTKPNPDGEKYNNTINKGKDFSPLAETPQNRGYEKNENITFNDQIPEPDIESDIPFDLDDEIGSNPELGEEGNTTVTTPQSEVGSGGGQITNPAMAELDPKEKMLHAAQMAEQLIGYYETAHVLAQDIFTVSDTALQKKAIKEDVDLDAVIPLAEEPIKVKQFVSGINEEIKNVLTVSEEFKENIKPPLTRICAKRGWGMTDEQLVISMVGKDLLMKGYQIVGLRKGINSMLSVMGEANRLKKEEIAQMKLRNKIIMQQQQAGEDALEEQTPSYKTKPVSKPSNLPKDLISDTNKAKGVSKPVAPKEKKSVLEPIAPKKKRARKPSMITATDLVQQNEGKLPVPEQKEQKEKRIRKHRKSVLEKNELM